MGFFRICSCCCMFCNSSLYCHTCCRPCQKSLLWSTCSCPSLGFPVSLCALWIVLIRPLHRILQTHWKWESPSSWGLLSLCVCSHVFSDHAPLFEYSSWLYFFFAFGVGSECSLTGSWTFLINFQYLLIISCQCSWYLGRDTDSYCFLLRILSPSFRFLLLFWLNYLRYGALIHWFTPLDVHNSLGWIRAKARARVKRGAGAENLIQLLQVGAKNLVTWAITCHLLGDELGRSWSWE